MEEVRLTTFSLQSSKADITDATNILNVLVINLITLLNPVKQTGHNQNFH